MQTEAYTPEAMARRAVERLKSESISDHQSHLLRRIRPMGLSAAALKSADREINDRLVKFKLAEATTPRGDEFVIHQPHGIDLSVEVYQDTTGRTLTRKRSPEQIEEAIRKQTFALAYAEERQTLEDLLIYRIRAVYRIVREMARIRSLVLPDESLAEGLHGDRLNFDPWICPEPWDLPKNVESCRDLHPEVVDLILAAERLPVEDQYERWCFEKSQVIKHPGVALFPPPVPAKSLNERQEPVEGYDPFQDLGLMAFVRIAGAVSDRLYIERGSNDEPQQGKYGLLMLLDPEWIRLTWPTRLQLVAWENLLIEETLDLYVSGGIHHTKRALQKKYGLLDREIRTLIRLATNLALKMTESSTEDVRAIMQLRLEDYVRRSRDSLDLKSELNGLKQISIVMGLAQEKKEDYYADMIEAVKTVAAERKGHLTPQNQLPTIATTAQVIS